MGGGGSIQNMNRTLKDNRNLLRKRKKSDKKNYSRGSAKKTAAKEKTRDQLKESRLHKENKESKQFRAYLIAVMIIVVLGLGFFLYLNIR